MNSHGSYNETWYLPLLFLTQSIRYQIRILIVAKQSFLLAKKYHLLGL